MVWTLLSNLVKKVTKLHSLGLLKNNSDWNMCMQRKYIPNTRNLNGNIQITFGL